jgi:hypothetical protein
MNYKKRVKTSGIHRQIDCEVMLSMANIFSGVTRTRCKWPQPLGWMLSGLVKHAGEKLIIGKLETL